MIKNSFNEINNLERLISSMKETLRFAKKYEGIASKLYIDLKQHHLKLIEHHAELKLKHDLGDQDYNKLQENKKSKVNKTGVNYAAIAAVNPPVNPPVKNLIKEKTSVKKQYPQKNSKSKNYEYSIKFQVNKNMALGAIDDTFCDNWGEFSNVEFYYGVQYDYNNPNKVYNYDLFIYKNQYYLASNGEVYEIDETDENRNLVKVIKNGSPMKWVSAIYDEKTGWTNIGESPLDVKKLNDLL